MSRYNTALIFIIFFLFYGCSPKEPQPVAGKRSFVSEDLLIVNALEYQRLKRYDDAMKTYKTLYEKSNKVTYLEEEARMSFFVKNNVTTYDILNYATQKYPQNLLFKKLQYDYYIRIKDYKSAEKMALEVLKEGRDYKSLSMLGDVYLLMGSYDLSLKYYESAFKLNNSENVLLNMVNILYENLNRKKEAISYLETYIRIQNASQRVYFTLIRIYGKDKNVNGLISTYKGLYSKFKVDKYGKEVTDLLLYKKDIPAVIKFLEKSNYRPEALMNIYSSNKDYKNAYRIAEKIYDKTNNIDYLGKMAMFEYESNKDHINTKILQSISDKFEKVLKDFQDPTYLNYYGYLLIDHDIDVKKGIKLVKLALKRDKKSLFYLDSLAWGYYKLGECQKSLKIMKQFINDTSEPEVLMHYKLVQKCLINKGNRVNK